MVGLTKTLAAEAALLSDVGLGRHV